jgi:hypothetical protein
MNQMERLQELTRKIEDATDGRQRFENGVTTGGVYIHTDHSAYTGLLMRKDLNFDTGEFALSFEACIRRMGNWMNAQEFKVAADEIQEMNNLLYELEQSSVTVTQEDMRQWSDWLSARQIERAMEQAHEQEPQIDLTMELT